MKSITRPAILAAMLLGGPVLAADEPPLSPALQKLDVSVGQWVFHGETLDTPFGKAGKWTWNEACQWSENGAFLVCSFTNDWAGKLVKSLVVDTYNEQDKSFWHYEMFTGGGTGARPFISRMTIAGHTRTEYGQGVDHGKKILERITYEFDSSTHVKVKIEISRHAAQWVTVDTGEGFKKP